MKKTFFRIILIPAVILIPFLIYGQESGETRGKLIIFHSLACHECIRAKNEIMPDIEKKFKDRINIEYLDIADIENYKLLLSLEEKYSVKLNNEMPVFYCEGSFLNGKSATKDALDAFIVRSLQGRDKGAQKGLPSVDLITRFKAFKVFAIVNLGLIDGINPCAFTVIVFFMSFLAVQGYRKKELIVIGLCFISMVFITYLLVGIGAFVFLYRLEKFWLVTKIINVSIGLLSFVLGGFALYDFFKFKKTGKTEGLTLQLPLAVKNQIHKIIGLHYRVNKAAEGNSQKRPLLKLILSALITGFLVSILEAVCTGQAYLPTITFVLKTSHFKIQALGYLLLYNLMFITPLLLIFFSALFGATSEQFSGVLKKHLLTVKILMAIVFFGLGIFLIWRA
jgi:cytochrome c biogenesis protein CcdA